MTSSRRTYVLDTSVLLSEPQALRRFEEHAVVLPLVVLTELEAKRNHPELGWAARHTDLDDIVSSAWTWFEKHPDGYRSAANV